ncbi:MAG: EF-P lysine aminoacylase GenX [Pseudomonadales bacterium]|nr:EF-P lysine aminoacylase GenX [Pseudomonadales bacterium]
MAEHEDDLVEPDFWRPNADWETIEARARLLRSVREFFYHRHVIEVETPLLSQGTITDPHISPLVVNSPLSSNPYYLQTSPEYAMKRLLASGAGSIFQIAKAFRSDEVGRKHNPEFTLLEWYRLGWDHLQLIEEVDNLLVECLGCGRGDTVSYYTLFQQYLEINPHCCDENQLRQVAERHINIGDMALADTDAWLDLLFSHCIEPHLGQGRPTFVVEYPHSQAALAQVKEELIDGERVHVAKRFEVFFEGLELANGYHELTDPKEQKRRFAVDQEKLSLSGSQCLVDQGSIDQGTAERRPVDQRLLAAMESGLPSCAGVALGIDRLLMLMLGKDSLSEVLVFDFYKA